MVCTEITSQEAKQAVTSLCNKDGGGAVYLHHRRQTHVYFWAALHLFAAIISTGIEETGYCVFQQLTVLLRLYPDWALLFTSAWLNPFSAQIATSTWLLLPLEEEFRLWDYYCKSASNTGFNSKVPKSSPVLNTTSLTPPRPFLSIQLPILTIWLLNYSFAFLFLEYGFLTQFQPSPGSWLKIQRKT